MTVLDAFRLDGRLAVVTGASSGLGAHCAQVLASAGAQVVLAARRVDKLQDLAARIERSGGSAHVVGLDVSDAGSVRRCLDEICSLRTPDVLVNNAGITVTRPLLEQTESDFDAVLNTNLKGSWLMATESARRMVTAGRGGSIVNIASILSARVAGGVAPYAISKAAVVQASKAMALELARYGIRVNALLPGYVVTDLNRDFLKSDAGTRLRERIPARRFVELRDLDGPLLLLASDAGRAMTGSTVAVDHGHLVSSL